MMQEEDIMIWCLPRCTELVKGKHVRTFFLFFICHGLYGRACCPPWIMVGETLTVVYKGSVKQGTLG